MGLNRPGYSGVKTQFCESDRIRPVGLGPAEHFSFSRQDVVDLEMQLCCLPL